MDKEINMKKNLNIKTNINIVKKLVIFTELLILFLVISSSIAIAYTEFSEEKMSSNIHKNTVNQTKFSPKFELAPENPKLTEYINNKKYSQKIIVPPPIDFSYLKNIPNPDLNVLASTPLPASYDLRTLNKVTHVKNQGHSATCWIFATYGSLESYLMPGQNYNFSEQNMKNLLSDNYTNGFDRFSNGGGNYLMTSAYLTSWAGPMNNSCDPWNPKLYTSPTGIPIQKHIQNITYLALRANSTDNQEIKAAIMNYGGVGTSIYIDSNNTTIYNKNTSSYYYNGTLDSYHDVTIVGWNDSYSRNNFSITPPGDGAFIIKNSWGPQWGDNGFFYISYYDSNLGKQGENAVFTAESLNDYTNIYQHDPLGWTRSLGEGNFTKTLWCASVFTARSNETLKAVSFYTPVYNSNYTISIYNNTGSNPTSTSGPVVTQTGTIPTTGYHTIPLSFGARLQAGQNFSVVLELTTPGYTYPISISKPIRGYSSNANATIGESFVSTDGIMWYDLTSLVSNATICIKAFTDPVNASQIKLD
jgi:C1A family cysteine protease